ncbi:PLP-dependent transferase [Sanghuangporus baumii]|uniref:alanine--glyoxylate transaminase n=1 Tax=Sanghuangporus baumii TaxID=108892 RepID=A0A9Q5HUU6_SANBA|nr:PLP-dependent transferase [Sanghuangporus baumii]
MSHVSPEFVPVFGDCLRMLKEVLYAPNSQPFLIAGSGTLGWDQIASNLVEPGNTVLVLNTGYFGDSFADCLQTYGAVVDQVVAPLGEAVTQSALEEALSRKKYKLVTFTHVDTSTGVLSDAKMIGETVKRVSPDSLVILDGVCSVASEEIRQEEWNIDVVMSATQKGLGTPPGLSVLTASKRAIQAFENRKAPATSYYANWKRWLPIMRAYEAGQAMYFATPPVNLIYALNASLTSITKSAPSLPERFAIHKEQSARFRKAMKSMGLKPLAKNEVEQANGMTAIYFPDGLGASDILPRISAKGVVVAGGLHKDCKDKYFRVGHMGISVVDKSRDDVDRLISAIRESIAEAKAAKGIPNGSAADTATTIPNGSV